MSKLTGSSEAMYPMPYRENWALANGISCLAYYYDPTLTLIFSSDSGDVTDQIYKILIKDKIFKEIELRTGACYSLKANKSLLKEIFEAIEKIDVSTLKEGHKY